MPTKTRCLRTLSAGCTGVDVAFIGDMSLRHLPQIQFAFLIQFICALGLPAAAEARSVSSVSQPRILVQEYGDAEDAEPSLSDIQRDLRLNHARELLGKYYRRSTVYSGESVEKMNSRIYRWTYKRLPKRFRKQYQQIAQAIIDEGVKHQFDPVFLISVIQVESSFDPRKYGTLDEIGLMQVRPATGAWIAHKFSIPFTGPETLKDPIKNIRIGTAYMDYLRSRFESHARLYISAYNMGKRNVDSAMKKNIWPKDYARQVMQVYVDFYAEIKASQRRKNSRQDMV